MRYFQVGPSSSESHRRMPLSMDQGDLPAPCWAKDHARLDVCVPNTNDFAVGTGLRDSILSVFAALGAYITASIRKSLND